MEGFEIVGPSFVVTGTDDEEMDAAAAGTRQQIAFYGSTPAYRPVLELHGWGGLQDELNALSKQGEWVEMGELIDDEILNTFAVVGPPEADRPRAAPPLRRRRSTGSRSTPRTERPRPLDAGPRRHQGRVTASDAIVRDGTIRRAASRERGGAEQPAPHVGAEGVVGVAALLQHDERAAERGDRRAAAAEARRW